MQSVLDVHKTRIKEAAITHISSDVFMATIYMCSASRTPATAAGASPSPTDTPQSEVPDIALDARPSDAIAIAAHADAPLYLHRELLHSWPVSVAAIQLDAAAGICECLPPHSVPLDPSLGSSISPDTFSEDDANASYTRGTSDPTSRRKKTLPKLAPQLEELHRLYARLDVAVRCERFREAAALRDQISDILPIDRLREALADAVDSERFLEAARLRDEISRWDETLRVWEMDDMEGLSMYRTVAGSPQVTTSDDVDMDDDTKGPLDGSLPYDMLANGFEGDDSYDTDDDDKRFRRPDWPHFNPSVDSLDFLDPPPPPEQSADQQEPGDTDGDGSGGDARDCGT